jgi:hypothetical protein
MIARYVNNARVKKEEENAKKIEIFLYNIKNAERFSD